MSERYKLQQTETGPELVSDQGSHIPLPDPHGYSLSFWVKHSPFPSTLPWEWVITNMSVRVVTGMSSGYTRTPWGAHIAARRALRFWEALGYSVADR